MPIIQQATGTWSGTSFTPALPAASLTGRSVVVFVAGNTTVTTPSGWALRTSQVNFMGHYLFDKPGDGTTGAAFTSAAGQGTWWILELAATFDIAASANDSTFATTYTTPNLTPSSGSRTLLASLGSLHATTGRTFSGWTNSFVEQVDLFHPSADFPSQGGALLDVVASGAAYSTSATYSLNNDGRSAIIAAYADTPVQAEGTKNANATRAMGRY